ncbi:MAG TPA: bifunctional [glutamine synthetase] adenylyltransferase/[glutamine synthetase]-adenylyl-L-tyrosine phosphorylase [Streptosporangiaceae bacterium]|nr:bifunctional [glutamine synthetase] adenylyltransferase/[glutamine synthetase]-adenylyl-L-tyrosine phosphorylase [Streptosporangiaceae bacterium]
MPRQTTLTARLARMGFADPAQAERLVGTDLALDIDGDDADVLTALAGAADPDLALAALARIPRDEALLAALRDDPGLRRRLAAVLGASAALGGHLARHPDGWRLLAGPEALASPSAGELRTALLTAVGADPGAGEPAAGSAPPGSAPPGAGQAGDGQAGGYADPAAALRVAYRQRLLHLAARDLTGQITLDETAAELADLAAAVLEAALAIARSQLPAGAAPGRLAVIAMGKCGGRELNYASDVDVIFVAGAPDGAGESAGNGALRTATQLAAGLIRVCSQTTADGALFPVDPNLRPEGRDGPLVRTLASHCAYYQRWAKTWEFQALLKARPVAGDPELGAAYVEALTPLVWQAAQRDNFVEDVQAMRRRVIGTLPASQAGRQLKLGPGGLRDIEFAVQLLQLVHGRADETIRSPATLPALAALAEGGYVGREDAASLAAAYRFLRTVEHLLQLRQLRRTHTLPDDPAALRRLGRAMRAATAGPASAGPPGAARSGAAAPGVAVTGPGPAGSRGLARSPSRADPAAELTAAWRQHAAEVRRLHEKLFYRPLLSAVARLPGEVARLTPEAAQARLEALGYADPAGALRHIEALTAGVSRRAAIQRTLLPVMLGWFADAAQPDAGLLAFRQISDALGNSPWYLRLLRDDTTVARRMARVLATSRYATDLLLRQPEMVALLGEDPQLTPRPAAALRAEAVATVRRHAQAPDAVAAVRALRRRELLRTAIADLLGLSAVEETGEALTAVAGATVSAALQVAIRTAEAGQGPLPTRLSVVAMGRFGGHETGYGSDADVMFVHDPLPGADEQESSRAAHAVAEDLRALLAGPAPDPPLLIDPGLRPEGRQGPLVRTLASYRAYYERWSVPWEAQALLRAEPVAGDRELGLRFTGLADEFRYPQGGIPEPFVREIRRIKARMEAERMPRGVDPALHLKLGPGGLADVEWVVQLLQLRHAHAVPGLRTTRTLAGLTAAAEAELVGESDAAVLGAAWRLAARIRDAAVLVRGRPSDMLPARQPELAAVASVLGYPAGGHQDLVQDYRRSARRARAVMERLFYG